MTNNAKRPQKPADVDARIGNAFIEVKYGADSLRTVQTSLLKVAYALGDDRTARGLVVLVDSSISGDRLRQEWERAASILRADVVNRLSICLYSPDHIIGIPHDPDAKTQEIISQAVESERASALTTRTDYSFVIKKLLLHRWLTSAEPVTSEWLARKAGCSYPAVARALRSLGNLVKRGSDRRVSLGRFPRDEFAHMVAIAERARSTTRFADRSGQPRSAETHLRRLVKLNPPGVAVGGVLGAEHYYSDLDLVGTPRLDLSLHSPGKPLDLEFIKRLDPALQQVDDPSYPASVVVHAVRHADPLFTPRDGGLAWADPLECLFDLLEMRLESQALEYLEALQRQRPAKK